MIDGRGFDLAGTSGGGQQQQGHAIRAARNGDAEPRSGADQRIEIGAESINQGSVREPSRTS